MDVLIFIFFVFHWIGYSSSRIPDVSGYYPDISGGVEVMDGDILISGLFDLHRYDVINACGTEVDISGTYRALAFRYAVEQINKRNDILPNLTLGYVFLDCCKKGSTALARTLYTVKDKRWSSDGCSRTSGRSDQTCSRGFDYFPVTGSIGPQSSLIARLTTAAMGLFHIPQISNYVTSDEYSSRDKYPYFLRTVPPDWFQVVAMKSMFVKFGWKYISVIYGDGYYGRAAVKDLDKALHEIGACFGVKEMVDHATTESQWNRIVDHVIDHKNARVVVLFLYSKPIMRFIETMRRRNAQDEFIIIAADSISVLTSTPAYLEKLPEGMLGVTIASKHVPDFDEYFKSMTTAKANETLILQDFWQTVFNCSMAYGAPNACRPDLKFGDSDTFVSDPLASVVIDSVNVMVTGIDAVLKENCPGATEHKIARGCVTGPELMEKLRKTKLRGLTGEIEFNENGDIIGRYDIVNIQNNGDGNVAKRVGAYDIKEQQLKLRTDAGIRWPTGIDMTGVPESVCSKPCRPGQQRIQRDVTCCWDCRNCRENERTDENRTHCIRCEKFKWPDPLENFTSCVEIEYVVIAWSDVECIAVVTCTVIGLAVTLVMFVLFTKFRDEKLIKASSIELMYILLVAVFWSLLMVFSFLSYPDEVTCYANFFGFNVSFASSYAPLLVKARRINAIFASGKKTTKAPPMIRPQSQIIMCLVLITGQILICLIICLIYKPFPEKYMPVPTVKMVELGCHSSVVTVLVPLIYNLVLVAACAIFTFRSRGVPANFKETRFISFSVYTTLILWIALLPTYYTATSQRYRIIYLTSAMIIHSYVIQCCLFLPKIYGVMYVKEADLQVVRFGSGSGSGLSFHNGPSAMRMQGAHRQMSDEGSRRFNPKSLSLNRSVSCTGSNGGGVESP